MSDFVSDVYDDASNLGVIQSFIGLIFASIIGLVLLFVGYTYIASSNEYVGTKGKITNVLCTNVERKTSPGKKGTNTQTTKSCVLTVEYLDKKTEFYKNTLNTNDNNVYKVGQTIQIEYLKSDPNQIRLPGFADSTLGYISSGISIVLILGASFNYYLASNYKLYASAQGAKTVYSVFK